MKGERKMDIDEKNLFHDKLKEAVDKLYDETSWEVWI